MKKQQRRRSIMMTILTFLLLGMMGFSATATEPVQGQGNWSLYLPSITNGPEQPPKPSGFMCRFGVTTLMNMPGYLDLDLLAQMRSGTMMDWNLTRPATLPAGMSYVGVFGTGVRYDATLLASIPKMMERYPGRTWQIGNEPDAYLQDNASPEEYAQQYYAIASAIRANDPTAKLAFGTVATPTPLRRAYLDRAWAELARLAGGQAQASMLVDIWTIHGYLFGEMPGEWGLGRYPKGMTGTEAPLLRFGNVADATHYAFSSTHDINLLAQLIRDFRTWMAAKGQRTKPLYITEYGVAFAPLDPPTRDVFNVSDADTASFMVDTFDFFRTAADASTGMPGDSNLLVQRWYWFTINELRYRFGGVLMDTTTFQITEVGHAYIQYTDQYQGEADCNHTP